MLLSESVRVDFDVSLLRSGASSTFETLGFILTKCLGGFTKDLKEIAKSAGSPIFLKDSQDLY
ncbi:MAG TPA: hypothetical protein DDW42_03595 [Desulfobacteraceae bacterium]|nr:hypothetical protein [Desulfobacteraceae bacterium]